MFFENDLMNNFSFLMKIYLYISYQKLYCKDIPFILPTEIWNQIENGSSFSCNKLDNPLPVGSCTQTLLSDSPLSPKSKDYATRYALPIQHQFSSNNDNPKTNVASQAFPYESNHQHQFYYPSNNTSMVISNNTHSYNFAAGGQSKVAQTLGDDKDNFDVSPSKLDSQDASACNSKTAVSKFVTDGKNKSAISTLHLSPVRVPQTRKKSTESANNFTFLAPPQSSKSPLLSPKVFVSPTPSEFIDPFLGQGNSPTSTYPSNLSCNSSPCLSDLELNAPFTFSPSPTPGLPYLFPEYGYLDSNYDVSPTSFSFASNNFDDISSTSPTISAKLSSKSDSGE